MEHFLIRFFCCCWKFLSFEWFFKGVVIFFVFVHFFFGGRFPRFDPKKPSLETGGGGGDFFEADPEAIWKHVLEQVGRDGVQMSWEKETFQFPGPGRFWPWYLGKRDHYVESKKHINF